MTPIFADAIDIPIVLFFGIIVLVPLIAFEVFIEALVLKRIWHLPYGELCTFTFFANFWSLLAGIPTKVLNAFLYAHLLPDDIPGFFARYPFAPDGFTPSFSARSFKVPLDIVCMLHYMYLVQMKHRLW